MQLLPSATFAWPLETLHRERRRPAGLKCRLRPDLVDVLDFKRFYSRSALIAGGTPAVPVKSTNGSKPRAISLKSCARLIPGLKDCQLKLIQRS